MASSTPGTDVVWMAMLPVLATTVPAAGVPAAVGAELGSAPAVCGVAVVVCGAPLALLAPFAVLGLAELAPGEAGIALPPEAAVMGVPAAGVLASTAFIGPPAGEMDWICEWIGMFWPPFNSM